MTYEYDHVHLGILIVCCKIYYKERTSWVLPTEAEDTHTQCNLHKGFLAQIVAYMNLKVLQFAIMISFLRSWRQRA